MNKSTRYSPEVRERRFGWWWSIGGYESQWAAIVSVASKLGCTAETLRKRVRRVERDAGERLKALERENRELRRGMKILRKAAAFLAQAEFDRRGT